MKIKIVTVVGANGTMGTNVSAIFASFGDAKVYLVSRDIEKSKAAILRAGKTVKADSIISHLIPADYSMLADCVSESDLVFESAAENLDIKIDLHTKIGQSLKKGAVVVLCSDKYKQEMGMKDKAVVKGYGHRVAPMLFDKKIADSADSDYVLPWTRQACLDAYRRAGLTVDDIDFFETHDCFTSSEFAAISAFGIAAPGKECEAVEDGIIAFDGTKPINPSGGLIGCGHPVGASGVRMFVDLYKQVTGKAGDYQVKDAKNGMMLNIGGSATTNYVFIVGKE